MFPTIASLLILATNPSQAILGASDVSLASHKFSLENRYAVASVNTVFKDNILLTLNYMDERVNGKNDINWEEVVKPSDFEFELKPGETFAFHDQILPEYKDSVTKTTNAHFNFSDGFKTDGWLYGDGVCHLASFIHVAALEAGLKSVSLARHDFATIPEVDRKNGVSIKYMPGEFANSSRQNLYVTNNQDKPVTFVFKYDGTNLTVRVLKDST